VDDRFNKTIQRAEYEPLATGDFIQRRGNAINP
jgi:hypothetical protein